MWNATVKKKNRKQRRKNRFKQAMVERYEKKRRTRERESRVRAKPREAATIDDALHWYVVYTAPRQERRAAQALRDAGIVVYEALVRARVSHARRQKDVDRPSFPRYLFIGFPPMRKAFGTARGCDGVHNLVGVDGEPLRVRAKLLERIEEKLQLEAGAEYRRQALRAEGEPVHGMEIGEQVRLKEGAFQGFYALISALIGAEAAEVEINIFGRSSTIHMPVAALEVL